MKRSRNPLTLGLSRKGKKFIASNPRLFTISESERQHLLSDRVANILENSCKFEDYGVHLTEEKVNFPEIPLRLERYREGESPLWRRASVPFEAEEEEEYLRKLTESNQIKILEVPKLGSIVKGEVEAEPNVGCSELGTSVKVEQSGTTAVKLEQYDYEDSCSSSVTGKDGALHNEQIMDSSPEVLSSPTSPTGTSSSKKFFPIFKSSQRSRKESGGFSTQVNNSGMEDFETPKAKSRFNIWGSKKEKSGVKQSVSQEWKPPPISKSDHKDLAQDLLSLFLEKTDADVTVYGREEKPIRAHKLILKARCPKLLADIVADNNAKSERKRDIIPLTCFSHMAVKCLMCFIYCGRLLPPSFKLESLSPRDLEEIIQLGQKYGIDLNPDNIETNGLSKKETKDSFSQTTVPENDEKSIQTDDMEMEREEYLNDARDNERSFQYHNKSMDFNHSYDNNSQSPDLFEDSFNDKVFANKLGDSTTRKRRRTRSERSFKIADSGDSESDCIVILDDEEDNQYQAKDSSHSKENTLSKSPLLRSPLSKSRHSNATDTPRRSISAQNNELFPIEPTWSRSCDDTFFANLPADEDLLNMPPTSPSGYGRASPILPTSPISIIPSISLSSPEPKQCKKTAAKKQSRKKSDEVQKKPKKGKQRCRAKIDDDYFQFESDEEETVNPRSSSQVEKATRPPRKHTSPSASQGTSTQTQSNPTQTPMLNYSLIDTPILKKELKRYGLKPLPRSKAKILLRHIYNETHK